MDSLHGILVFLRVVEAGTLSGAARSLGVSASAVSAGLARLERSLAVRLLDRTTRRLSLTTEGAEFYARCKQIVADLEEAKSTLGRAAGAPSGKLRAGVPWGLGRLWIVPRLPEFVRRYPAVNLEIVCSDFVPHTMEHGLDISVQIGTPRASRLAVRRLASTRYVVCASAGYFEEHDMPGAIEDLAGHACLIYRRPRDGRLREWQFGKGPSVRQVPVSGKMIFNSNDTLAVAACAGLGIVQVAEHYVQASLEKGELVEVLQEHASDGYEISAVFPRQQPVPPKVRAFVDFLAALFDPPPWTGTRRPAE